LLRVSRLASEPIAARLRTGHTHHMDDRTIIIYLLKKLFARPEANVNRILACATFGCRIRADIINIWSFNQTHGQEPRRAFALPNITVTTRAGALHQITAQEGSSVMEAIRDHGIDDLQAICGGCCSCATCHVYIGAAYLDTLTPIGEDESDLLDSSRHRTAASRLACQIRCSPDLDGLTVTIAAED
jgi:2Fe-2S ferredoxin